LYTSSASESDDRELGCQGWDQFFPELRAVSSGIMSVSQEDTLCENLITSFHTGDLSFCKHSPRGSSRLDAGNEGKSRYDSPANEISVLESLIGEVSQ